MRLRLIAVGARRPSWAEQGFDEYARRLPPALALELAPVAATPRRGAGDARRAVAREGERVLAAVPRGARLVALDEGGELWDSRGLAGRLRGWMGEGRDLALAVGGADGHAPAVLERAEQRWSLSRLTFPHALVPVLVAEQFYRAWTLLQGHPYHRG